MDDKIIIFLVRKNSLTTVGQIKNTLQEVGILCQSQRSRIIPTSFTQVGCELKPQKTTVVEDRRIFILVKKKLLHTIWSDQEHYPGGRHTEKSKSTIKNNSYIIHPTSVAGDLRTFRFMRQVQTPVLVSSLFAKLTGY